MKPLRGCLAALTLPGVLVGVTASMLRRGVRIRRRGNDLFVSYRRYAGPTERLEFTLAVPIARIQEVAAALATAVADAAASAALHVGIATEVFGEEPILVTVAPQRDLVADRVERSILVGEARLRPCLWLTLTPGTYLAEVVPPARPFAADSEAVVSLLAGGRCRHALLVRVEPGAAEWKLHLTLAADSGAARHGLAQGRRALGGLSGWRRR